jgi:condensin complex subunit 2
MITLVKPENMDSLNVKEWDLEFTVDPLFKKTSAEFDEGGAKGLLLNHLNVYGNKCKLIFDSADAVMDLEDTPSDTGISWIDVTELQR